MRRLIQTQMNPSSNLLANDQRLCLEEVLQTNINRFDQLNEWIRMAKSKCHFPSKHYLTLEESAAIYLFTIKSDKNSFYSVIQQDIQSNDPSICQSWLPYFQLFRSAVEKLPNMKVNVWRSVTEDYSKKLIIGDEVIWSNPSLCSLSIQTIKGSLESNSILCSIETTNGKDISMYSQNPNHKEIILCGDTRLQVMNNVHNQLYLREYHRSIHRLSTTIHNGLKNLSTQWWNVLMLIVAIVFVIITGKTMSAIELFSLTTLMNVSPTVTLNQSILITESPIVEIQADSFGNRYKGQYLNGKRHGKGQMDFANGYKYIGDWVDDTPTGYGTFIWTNGDHYEGEFQQGQRHGRGSYYFANGEKYIGDWVADTKHGFGTSSLAVGSYEGQFINDTMHGKGAFYFADGCSYQGDWTDNKQDGEGIFIWVNGDRYEGGFKAGQLHGKGSYYFGNGNKFTGEWVDGERMTDRGSFTWASERRHVDENAKQS